MKTQRRYNVVLMSRYVVTSWYHWDKVFSLKWVRAGNVFQWTLQLILCCTCIRHVYVRVDRRNLAILVKHQGWKTTQIRDEIFSSVISLKYFPRLHPRGDSSKYSFCLPVEILSWNCVASKGVSVWSNCQCRVVIWQERQERGKQLWGAQLYWSHTGQ